ncbi:protein takeout-like [Anastrepha ludens]|uniref:protein takeout-like n=1 Tax=Anastrepha ludens TaxID=28586 RepID=UPI0023B16BBD|nr:protein takeout-like [Anastrepha ludens]
MLRTNFIIVLAFTAYCVQSAKAQIALDFEKCRFGDAACSTNVANIILKKYAKTGLRALNLIPFDPLHIKSLTFDQNPNSPINIRLNFKEIDILGLANANNVKVEGLTRDVKGPILLEGTLPQAIIRGPYQGSGTILGLPFKGKGNCEIVLKNIKLTSKLNGKLVKKADDEYLSIVDVSLTMSKPDNVHFQFGGLFDGNKDLADTANSFVNENWPEIYGELRPAMQKAFALIVHGITNNVFSKNPYPKLFLAK